MLMLTQCRTSFDRLLSEDVSDLFRRRRDACFVLAGVSSG